MMVCGEQLLTICKVICYSGGNEEKNVGRTDDDTTYYVRYASQRSVIMTYYYDPARSCRSQLVM